MRHLATIKQISDLRPIPNADRIEVAQVDGWEVVVKKGEFNIGEHIVYIEIDSVVPERPEFEFLRDKKFRVRTIKLRGQISQGLILPLSILPKGKGNYPLDKDVTEILGIKKYDPEAQQESLLLTKQPKKIKNPIIRFLIRFKFFRKIFLKSKKKGGFPDWIKKTDEERVQCLPTLFETERDHGTKFSVTEKMDGQSATYFLRKVSKHKYDFGVCSRNIYLGTPDNSSYWEIARKYDMENVLKKLIGNYDTIVLQGEICGDGIQGNKYQISKRELFVFNLIYPDHKCDTREIERLIRPLGLKTVPILEDEKVLPSTISELVEYSKGYSTVRTKQKREGVVMRNNKSNISFKVINPEFLLAEGD